MADLSFKPIEKEQEDELVVKHNTRLGVILFCVYVLVYGGFMLLSAFDYELMGSMAFGGLNVAIVYGFFLIIIALVLALLYMKLCLTSQKKG